MRESFRCHLDRDPDNSRTRIVVRESRECEIARLSFYGRSLGIESVRTSQY